MSDRIVNQINTLIDALRTRELEEKRRYDAAIDIEDMAEATAVTIDARIKIQQLRKWTYEFVKLQKEITEFFIPSETDAIFLNTESDLDESYPEKDNDADQVKVGYYIRSKLRELGNAGFQPTSEHIELWQDKNWSKKTLNLNYPFARLFFEEVPLNSQLATDDGRNRYWAEVFELGTIKLLICSQWYKQDREFFDRWFDSLPIQVSIIDTEIIAGKPIEEQPPAVSESIDEAAATEFFSKAPTEFSLLGRTYSVSSWDDVLIKLCETMILKKPYKALRLGVNKVVAINNRPVLCLDERGLSNQTHKLSNGLFVTINGSGREILPCCESILCLCGYDRNELKIS